MVPLMSSVKPWASALNIPQTTYQAWVAEAPQHESLTYWCLKTGKVKSERYLSWAREHYGLASIRSDFFRQNQNPLWEKIKSVANWSAQMIPVHEWDGVVFIACAEPPQDIQWSFPVQYLLADVKDLESHWATLQSLSETPQAVLPPEGISSSVPMASPEGLSLPENLMEKSFAGVPPIPVEQPEGLSFPPSPVTTEALSPGEASSSREIPTSEKTEKPGMLLDFSVPPMTPKKEPDISEALVTTAPTATPFTHYSEFLHAMKNDFKGGMILSVENDHTRPIAWDESFRKKEKKADELWSLNAASAFRVACRTKMPYLGHVVETPTNRDFFQSWGFETLPTSVLIQPILQGHTVTHLILALTDGQKKSFQLIDSGEKLAKQFLSFQTDLKASA